ncbi:MAG: FAD-dependent oxidoreductase [Lachnospiraceae bacterium]|nr:FAD-dependent oxidoreductase [Lachnospiraceae bacterium]
MLKTDNIKIRTPFDPDKETDLLRDALAKKIKIRSSYIKDLKIIRRSLDARKKNDIFYVYSVAFLLGMKVENITEFVKKSKGRINYYSPREYDIGADWQVFRDRDEEGNLLGITPAADISFIKDNKRPCIVGTGPAGLFCGYELARVGLCPILIERGDRIEDRVNAVEHFWETGNLDPASNIQFGEGGAGTFSDGKLFSHVHDKSGRVEEVLKTFVRFGADPDILYDSKPHIGTDVLREVIKNMRTEMEIMGATFMFRTTFISPVTEKGKLTAIRIKDKDGKTDSLPAASLILAPGHSARDTFINLHESGLVMENKPFAVGFRFIHPQEDIDTAQYGCDHRSRQLPPADYKVTAKASSGRAVYSFCMCPGGYVVNASSEDGMLAVNGMSNRDRASGNANSAIVITVDERDYGEKLFDGMRFQRELEKNAYILGNGKIPVEVWGDFCDGRDEGFNRFNNGAEPMIKGAYEYADLRKIMPEAFNLDLMETVPQFARYIHGYDSKSALLAGVETRTSSPVKMQRFDDGQSSVRGIYPCGEGAGYAGGITSAAVDGLKVAEKIVMSYNQII